MPARRTAQPSPRYHHGDLRRALINAAVEMVGEVGPVELSLRELARRVGVSHAASSHHFADKAGLLTAVAAEGHRMLGDGLAEAWERTGDFIEIGVAYVTFAVEHRAYFEVMFRPELYRSEDPELVAAVSRSGEYLYEPLRQIDPRAVVVRGVAAWSFVHGLAELWLNGLLPQDLGEDPAAIARGAGRYLFDRSIASSGPKG